VDTPKYSRQLSQHSDSAVFPHQDLLQHATMGGGTVHRHNTLWGYFAPKTDKPIYKIPVHYMQACFF